VVNAGLGSALDAAALVAYVNVPVGQTTLAPRDYPPPAPPSPGVEPSAFTLGGRLARTLWEEPRRRARNGEPLPWKCLWWGIGNEMYGAWQLGHAPFEAFVARHRRFAAAMRRASPHIKLVGTGALHLPANAREKGTAIPLEGKGFGFHSSWTGRMMKELSMEPAAGRLTLHSISEHFYIDTEKATAAQHAKQASSGALFRSFAFLAHSSVL